MSEPGISFGLMLLFGGVLLFLFRQKPAWLQMFIQDYAGTVIAAVLIVGGFYWESVRLRRDYPGAEAMSGASAVSADIRLQSCLPVSAFFC